MLVMGANLSFTNTFHKITHCMFNYVNFEFSNKNVNAISPVSTTICGRGVYSEKKIAKRLV